MYWVALVFDEMLGMRAVHDDSFRDQLVKGVDQILFGYVVHY